MDMIFCDCGSLMVPEGRMLKCRKCGRQKKITVDMDSKITSRAEKREMVVIEDNKPDLPETEKKCAKCGNIRAYWWLIQTRSADEPPTQFFRCTECKHTWREYK